MLTGISFQERRAGVGEKAVAQLEADIKAGAVGVGEDRKSLRSRTGRPTAHGCASTIPISIRVGGSRA